MATGWKWYLLHPVLARVTAYVAPSLVPVFYTAYSSVFLTFTFGWEVALPFVAQHAAFYATTSVGSPALCYVVALVIHCQKLFLPFDPYKYMYTKCGEMACWQAYVAFHWNILRGLSFSVDFIQAEKGKTVEDAKSRRPSYWKTLSYMLYLPTIHLGPPLSTAMSNWEWMADKLDFASLVGYALSLEFDYYVIDLFHYGFAGALANAEGIKVPAASPCIARLHRCSRFWRYFDRGMHLWIRRYIYEPVMGGTCTASRLIFGTAAAFTFTCTWHSFHSRDIVWCGLSALGIALEVVTIEIKKWTSMKKFEPLSAFSPPPGPLAGVDVPLRIREPSQPVSAAVPLHLREPYAPGQLAGAADALQLREPETLNRYLASPDRMRTAKALLGAPHFLLTICACLFQLVKLEVSVNICRRILTGFPFPMVPIVVVMYSLCHISMDIEEWEEASATAKKKQALL